MSKNNCFLIIPAAGLGFRMNSLIPKQYLILDNGFSVLDNTIKKFLDIKEIIGIVLSISKESDYFNKSIYKDHKKIIAIAKGGKQRFNSVMNSLKILKKFAQAEDWILIHDAVRPCVKNKDIITLIRTAKKFNKSVILASNITDTIKVVDNEQITKTIDREKLYQAHTPQIFKFKKLYEAMENAIANNLEITDESEAMEAIGEDVRIINTCKTNIKITTKNDIDLVNYYIKKYEN